MDIPHNAHALVIDGRKLLLFKNDGNVAAPKLNVATHREQDSAATHDQGSDKPGQTQSSVGGVRSGYEETDFHQQDEDRFAAAAADMLKCEVLAGRIEALIVIAAPRANFLNSTALGVVRPNPSGLASPPLRSRFRAAAIAFSSKHKARRGNRAPSLSNFLPNKA